MKTYEFTLNVGGISIHSNEDLIGVSKALYAGACEDAFVSSVDEAMYIEFEREAPSMQEALIRAIKDVESTVDYKLVVTSVDGDYVSLGEASLITGVKKSTLTKYKKGNFGGGNFPSPARKAAKKDPLWRLLDIAEWLYQKNKINKELLITAKTITVVNTALDNRLFKADNTYKQISESL